MIYPNRSKTWNLDCAKAPEVQELSDRTVNISNINRLAIVQPRELSHQSKSKFLTDRGMHSIIFFDQYCPLCRRTINYLARYDQHKRFHFAPLDGTTAENMFLSNLAHLRDLNTVVLVEKPEGKIWLRGRAVFRVLWLLGGSWKLVGWLYKMPFVDLLYKFIAKHRKRGGDLPPLSVHLLP